MHIQSIGEKEYRKYAPYLLTVFFFIFLSNLLGIVPFFPGGANVTGNIAVTMVLALCTFIAVNVFGNKHYWKEILWPDVPVFLNRGCGHMSWVNSKAIEIVGITEDTPNPPGGEFIKNEDGTLRGVVTDQAQDLFMKKVPVYDDEDQKQINLLAQAEFLNFQDTGMSILEISHRAKAVEKLAEYLCKQLKIEN